MTSLLPVSAVGLPSLTDYVHPFLIQQNSEGTRLEYRSEIRLFSDWLGKPIVQTAPLDLIAYRQHLEERGLKPATVHKKLSVLRSFFSFITQMLSLPNPALCVRLPKITDQSMKATLNLQEVGKLLSVIDTGTHVGRRDLAIMGLLLVNGLRSIEVSRANVGDIREIEGYTVLKVRGKGGKIADAKLRQDVQDGIVAYLKDRNDAAPDEPLFLGIGNLAKGRISPKTVQARVRYYLTLAGIAKPNLSCHSLRHTCAVLTLSLGKADLVQVQRLLRHSDPKVTMRYIQTLDWLKDNAVDRNPISLV